MVGATLQSPGAATQPGNDATPQGTHMGCPYGDSKSRLDPLRTPVFAGRHTNISRFFGDQAAAINGPRPLWEPRHDGKESGDGGRDSSGLEP